MKASDIAALPIPAGAALRHRRFFHPDRRAGLRFDRAAGPTRRGASGRVRPGRGARFQGRRHPRRPCPTRPGWPGGCHPPRSRPRRGTSCWSRPDSVRGSCGGQPGAAAARHLLVRGAMYSGLVPLRYPNELWWVRARCTTPIGRARLVAGHDERRIGRRRCPIRHRASPGHGEFEPLAPLTFTDVIPAAEERHHDVAFDPVRHSAPDVQVWPDWLRELPRAGLPQQPRGPRRRVAVSVRRLRSGASATSGASLSGRGPGRRPVRTPALRSLLVVVGVVGHVVFV